MNGKESAQQEMNSQSMCRVVCRRMLLTALAGSMAIVAPGIAAASPLPHNEIRVPRVDRQAIENLQRWVSGGHDTWCKDARLVASAEMRRIAPEFAGYEYDLISLPLETKRQAAARRIHLHIARRPEDLPHHASTLCLAAAAGRRRFTVDCLGSFAH